MGHNTSPFRESYHYDTNVNVEPGPSEYKSNALTTERKSRLSDAVCHRLHIYDILYRIAVLFIEATHHVICQPDLPSRMNELCNGT